MEQKISHPPEQILARQWSYRILSASLFGIFFFTLFPYWIDFSQKHAPGRSPFLLGGPLHFDGALHTFLNALLFAPFGFALSRYFARRGNSVLKSIALAVIAGGALSYSIEMIQLYMPSRDSAWDDVLANTAGAVLGLIFGLIAGEFILRKFSEWESRLDQFLSLRKLFIAALIYFGAWLVISIPLQTKSRLENWDPNPFLLVGYDAYSGTRWSGAVSRIQIWDRALSTGQAKALTANSGRDNKFPPAPDSSLLASYDLSQTPPIVNQAGPPPLLTLRPLSDFPALARQSHASVETPVLMSADSASSLSAAVRHSNQLSLLVDCLPTRATESDGAIFEIANFSRQSDLVLWQDRSYLVFSLRNGLYSPRSALAWHTARVFTANVRHSIVFSYDGAKGSFYIDGKKAPENYYFGPGAALVGEFIRLKTDELVAYSALFYSLVFLPVGFLLGLALRIMPRHNTVYKLGIGVATLLPAIVLEAVLARISGRQMSIDQLIWSIGLTVAGMVWINLDSDNSARLSRLQVDA
jgi:glycopeptide antibiotics resistance protein